MTATVAVERTEQAPRRNDVPHAAKAADRAFLFNEEQRVVLAGRVIHRVDQVPLLPSDPFVGAAILVDHHPRQGGSFPPLSMGAALLALEHQLRFLKTPFDPGVAARTARSPIPVVEVFDVPSRVPASILRRQRQHFIDRRAPIRNLVQAPINQAFQSLRLVPR